MGYKEDTLNYYNNNADVFVSETLSANMTSVYECFEKHLSPGDRILDLGCGSGRDTKYFSTRGYQVVPIDGSIELCKIASEVSGIAARCITFDKLDYTNEFDAVWACASLLHVGEEELPEIIKKIHTSLREEGVLYASFKYGKGPRQKDDRFFFDCDETTIRNMFNEQSGFKIVSVFNTSDVREERKVESWINLIAAKL